MMAALKVGALVCCSIGVLIMVLLLTQVSDSQFQDYCYVSKEVQHHGSWTEYHVLATQAGIYGKLDGLALNNSYSKSFFDRATPGDRLRVSGWYSQLVRNGRVIKGDVNGGFLFSAFQALVAFVPLLIFIRIKNSTARIPMCIFTGLTEVLTIWIFSALFLFPGD